MTQASLSPDLRGALGAPSAPGDTSTRPAVPSEGALWMVALTSSSLVAAAVLLLALLLNNVVVDASLGGFISGIGIVIAALGIGGVSYSLVTARRAGYLVDPAATAAGSTVAPAGMHVVPALPPDLGRRKRRQLEMERSARKRQAQAIAAATAMAPPKARPVANRQPMPQPTTARPAPTRMAQTPTRVAPPRRVQTTRPRPAQTTASAPARPAPARVAPAPVMPVMPRPASTTDRASSRPITMPQAPVRPTRPAAWPDRVPGLRMPAPRMRPRTQVATFQVHAANVRAAAPIRPR